jgi:hypothetical protein
MSTWDIDPSGVQGVLARTGEVATGFDGALTTMASALEGAATASDSGPVSAALSEFVGSVTADVRAVFSRTQAAMNGCAGAVNAYVAGDLEMAANAQAAATGAPSGSFYGSGPR